MRSTKRESLLDVMVARTAGVIELHLRNGNKALALEAVEYAFKELETHKQPEDASQMKDDTHLIETTLDMRIILMLERKGLTTVGDVRKYDPMNLIQTEGVGRTWAIKILNAVGAQVPKYIEDNSYFQVKTIAKEQAHLKMK